ncbi:MAG: tRNA pseudouridine(38-40) synthase TruA [Acidobacteria bacterium]|nr:tRNA pseudouridine(38-40) synthase TruA [Acidobacteriota bacterium]
MRNLKLTLAYDGTEYVGWQRQAGGRSIQGALESALAEIEGAPVTVVGAGRTDAGVHALGQVASVRLAHGIEPRVLARALNAKLPADIRVLGAAAVGAGFHARYSARSKTYRYCVSNGGVAHPFAARYAWHVAAPLQLDAMRAAGDQLLGRHDFAAFQSTGSQVRSTVRTLSSLTIERRPACGPEGTTGGTGAALLTVEVEGDGFLRHMVRAIVGTLVEVGRGRRAADDITPVLESKRRDRAGPTAPAHGLFLVRVTCADA